MRTQERKEKRDEESIMLCGYAMADTVLGAVRTAGTLVRFKYSIIFHGKSNFLSSIDIFVIINQIV